MFKKVFALMALIGFAFTANVTTAHAHKGGGYHKHHAGGWHGVPIPKIRHRLRHRGFYKIHFFDRYLPVYKAIACKRGKRFKLKINRWGDVMKRKRIGWCGYKHHRRYDY